MDVCWICIGAQRAGTAAARAAQRTCDRHVDGPGPAIARARSHQARAGHAKRPQQRAGGYRPRQVR